MARLQPIEITLGVLPSRLGVPQRRAKLFTLPFESGQFRVTGLRPLFLHDQRLFFTLQLLRNRLCVGGVGCVRLNLALLLGLQFGATFPLPR
jgi:hypothetical protein